MRMEKSFSVVSPVSSEANKKSNKPEIYYPFSRSNLSSDHSDNSLMNRPLCSELSCTDAQKHKEGHDCIGFTEVTSSSFENIDKCGGYEDSDLELSLGLSLWVGDNVLPESIGTMQHAGTKRDFKSSDTFSEDRSSIKRLIGVKRSYNEAIQDGGISTGITTNVCRTRQTQDLFKKTRQENHGIERNNLSLYWNTCRMSQPSEPRPVSAEPPTKIQAIGWPPIRACRRNSLDSNHKPCGEKQAVGWPPIQAYRKNSLGSHPKFCGENQGNSRYVKVNMDGVAIGRKVDLSSHESYETLVQDLENMFQSTTESQNGSRTTLGIQYGAANSSMRLLDRTSDMVLTYEDKEGDCMLVGDIPWKMFVNTVKRLRILKLSETNALVA